MTSRSPHDLHIDHTAASPRGRSGHKKHAKASREPRHDKENPMSAASQWPPSSRRALTMIGLAASPALAANGPGNGPTAPIRRTTAPCGATARRNPNPMGQRQPTGSGSGRRHDGQRPGRRDDGAELRHRSVGHPDVRAGDRPGGHGGRGEDRSRRVRDARCQVSRGVAVRTGSSARKRCTRRPSARC